MMGRKTDQKELFSYSVDLDKRVRADNPLRPMADRIDFTFVREEVKDFYGYNGNESVDPAVIMKMMFLLFFDNVASERELMRIIARAAGLHVVPGVRAGRRDTRTTACFRKPVPAGVWMYSRRCSPGSWRNANWPG